MLLELKQSLGIGVPSVENYPLSTYQPITKEQNKLLSEYLNYYNQVIEDIPIKELTNKLTQLKPHEYSFIEQYPTEDYFKQAISNNIYYADETTELFSGQEYHIFSEEQLYYITQLYKTYSKKNPQFNSSTLVKNLSEYIKSLEIQEIDDYTFIA